MNPKSLRTPEVCTATVAACLLACGLAFLPSPAWAGTTNQMKPVVSATVDEHYDSNVMLQNEGGQARRESWVTSVLPVAGGRLDGTAEETRYTVCLQYAPDFTLFHGLSRESYLRHIGLLDLDLKHKAFTATASFKSLYTDGTTEPPTWGTVADGDQAPANGGPEVRNRRRNAYWIAKVAGRQNLGRAFVRGVFDARIWDFMTEDKFVQELVIQNYYDRSDVNGGFDFGFKADEQFEPYVGYRLGHQEQEFRAVPPFSPNAPSYSYENQYHRCFVGAAVKLSSRVSVSGEVGPSFHFFDSATISPADAADPKRDYLYFLFNGAFQITSNTTLKVVGNQHLLPASAGNAVFNWPSASGILSHRLSSRWRGSCRVTYSEFDFDGGIVRRDQVYSVQPALDYAFNRHLNLEAFYAYEWGVNLLDVPNGSQREYDRHFAGIRLKASY